MAPPEPRSKGKGGGTLKVLLGTKDPAWKCKSPGCGCTTNWASRVVCRECEAPAPQAVAAKAWAEAAKLGMTRRAAAAGTAQTSEKVAKDTKQLQQDVAELKKLKEQVKSFATLVQKGDQAAVAKVAAEMLEPSQEPSRDPHGVGAATKALEAFDNAYKDDKLGVRASLVADLEKRKQLRDAGRPLQVRIADLERELKAARASRDEAEEGLAAAEEAVKELRKAKDEGLKEVSRLEGLKRSLLQQSAVHSADSAGSGAAAAITSVVHETLNSLLPAGIVLLEPARLKLEGSLKDIAQLIDQAEALKKASALTEGPEATQGGSSGQPAAQPAAQPAVQPPAAVAPPPWSDDEIRALKKMFGQKEDEDGDEAMGSDEVERVRNFLGSDEGRKFRRVA